MVTVRRWYIFLVNIVSLQAVTWAIIFLLQNLLTLGSGAPVETTAFQIAVIVIGLPIFLVHWLWAQRLAGRETDELWSAVRRLYLYITLAIFLAAFAINTFDLSETLLRSLLGDSTQRSFTSTSPTEAVVQDLLALVVLGLLWFYHQRIVAQDAQATPETGHLITIRRVYIFGFSAAGVIMTTLAIISLLRWLMFQFGSETTIGQPSTVIFSAEVARLLVGIPLWLIFWQWAQHLFAGPNEEEHTSVLRKLYLYLVLLITVFGFVTTATIILAGFFRLLLDLPSQGDIRDPLPVMIVMAIAWIYHATILRGDAVRAGEAPRQAGVRRLYLYLVAAVGLAAFLVGLGGDISVLIRSLAGTHFGSGLKEELAWFTAALIAGLPVWLWPWRRAQLVAVAPDTSGVDERQSIVRKVYLYFYLFVATMTILSSAVYIVFQLLNLALGGRSPANLFSDLGHAIAFSLIAVGVWLYHGLTLRGDSQLIRREQSAHLANWRVAVVDTGEGDFGRATLDQLRHELPGLSLEPIGLTERAAEVMGMEMAQNEIATQLAQARLIVGPWDIMVKESAADIVTAEQELARAVVASPARKLLVPVQTKGWNWAGVENWNAEALVRQTVHAVEQIVAGEEVKPARPLGIGAIIGIVIGVLFLLFPLVMLLLFLLDF
jgi:hypothetical protein